MAHISTLQALLELEKHDDNVFKSCLHRENFRKTLFGGQVLGQGLLAATLTVEDRSPHSFHAYFLRAGSSKEPIYYEVENIRDGRSISSRRVVAMQEGLPIFHLSASFHKEEAGFEHQDAFPINIPSPEELIEAQPHLQKIPEYDNKESESSHFALLPIPKNLFTSTEQHPPEASFWLKVIEPLPQEVGIQAAALAFVSDLGLLATAVLPHPASLFDKSIVAASIDHAMWFHSHDFNMSEWMLCQTHSPWAGKARGLANASIYDRKGKLIVTTAQEGLIRPIN